VIIHIGQTAQPQPLQPGRQPGATSTATATVRTVPVVLHGEP
jgi:hypothetical protein